MSEKIPLAACPCLHSAKSVSSKNRRLSTPVRVDKLMADIEASHAKAGTRPFWERVGPFAITRDKQRAFIEESLAPIDAYKLICGHVQLIQNYSQHRFTTSDGRTFGVFLD